MLIDPFITSTDILFIILRCCSQKTANKQNKHWNCRQALVLSSTLIMWLVTIWYYYLIFHSFINGVTWEGTILGILENLTPFTEYCTFSPTHCPVAEQSFTDISSHIRFWMPMSVTRAVHVYLFWWCYIAHRAAVCCLLQCPAAAPCSCLVHTPHPAYLCPGTAGQKTHIA